MVGRRVRQAAAAVALLLLVSGCATTRAAATSAPAAEVKLSPAHQEMDLISVRHVVGAGQTLYRIARTYDISVDELMAVNGIEDPRTLKVGQELVIPGATQLLEVVPPGAQEAREEQALMTGKAPPPPVVSKVKISDPKRMGNLEWPVRGLLYARFGKKGKEPHDGIDLAAPLGTPVKTAAPGTVLYAGEQAGYGLIVILGHENDTITLYAHNRDLRVKTGQKVRASQVIATVGESGKTSGPHLHFEVRKKGMPVDPLLHLGPVPSS